MRWGVSEVQLREGWGRGCEKPSPPVKPPHNLTVQDWGFKRKLTSLMTAWKSLVAPKATDSLSNMTVRKEAESLARILMGMPPTAGQGSGKENKHACVRGCMNERK